MSYIAIAGGAMQIGSALFGGFSAKGNEDLVEEGRAAARQVKQDKMRMLGAQRTSALDYAQGQYATGVTDVGQATQAQFGDISQAGDAAYSQSGMATVGGIDKQVQSQTKDLLAGYKSSMTKLFDTRAHAKSQADLSFRSGEMSAEEAYQNTLTELDAVPTNFWEGAFG